MNGSAQKKPLPPPEAELTLEEAAQQFREYWGYPAMTAHSLFIMIDKLDWGPPGHWRQKGGWYLVQGELLSRLNLESAREELIDQIDEEEARRQSARSRPLWSTFVLQECRRIEMVEEVLAAYGCDTTRRSDFKRVGSVLDK